MKNITAFTLTALALSLSATASGQLIILDTFNTADSADLNSDLINRQSGEIADTSWIIGGGDLNSIFGIQSNRLELHPSFRTDVNAALDYDFATNATILGADGYVASFEMTPTDGNYTAFSMGAAAPLASRPVIDGATDFGLLMGADGSLQVFANSIKMVELAAGAISWTGGSTLDLVELSVLTDSFGSGSAFSVEMTVGGATIDLDPNTGGTAFSSTWDGGSNYMAFTNRDGSEAANNNIDNYSISAIPEPGAVSIVLGGAAMMMMIFRKHRRSV